MREVGSLVSRALQPPAAIFLQECTPKLLDHLEPHLRKAGFGNITREPLETAASNGYERYFLGLATRSPLSAPLAHSSGYHRFANTFMGRGLLYARVHHGIGSGGKNAHIALGCTHLESFVGKEHQVEVIRVRRKQLLECMRRLEEMVRKHRCEAAVLMGDFNWQEKEDGETDDILKGNWVDAWVEAGCPMNAKNTCYWHRLDRCYVFVPPDVSPRLLVQSVGLVGNKPGSLAGQKLDTGGKLKDLYPSDHRGLLVSCSLQEVPIFVD